MKHTIAKSSKAIAAAGAAAFILTGCSIITGETGDSSTDGSGEGSENPVYAEMASWDACEVLDNLQPITDYMGIIGYGSTTAQGGEPGNSEIGNTLDPEAIGCNGLFSLGEYQGYGMDGEIKVKIVPTENQDQALATYQERVTAAESESASGADTASAEFTDPWKEGTMISWTGSAEQPNVEVVALSDQWVFHVQLYYTNDWGLRGGSDPALPFTYEELNQWFVETYAPQVNQIVNDRLAEVQ